MSANFPNEHMKPEAGELRMKEWLAAEAQRRGCDPMSIYRYIARGDYRGKVKFRHVNQRVVFVRVNP